MARKRNYSEPIMRDLAFIATRRGLGAECFSQEHTPDILKLDAVRSLADAGATDMRLHMAAADIVWYLAGSMPERNDERLIAQADLGAHQDCAGMTLGERLKWLGKSGITNDTYMRHRDSVIKKIADRLLQLTPDDARRIPRRRAIAAATTVGPYDSRVDGSYRLRSWPAGDLLTPTRLYTRRAARPSFALIPPDQHAQLSAQLDHLYDGHVCYPVGYQIDYREGTRSDTFRVDLAYASYPEYKATAQYLNRNEEALGKVRYHFEHDSLITFASSAPPTCVWCTVTVQSGDGRFLARIVR